MKSDTARLADLDIFRALAPDDRTRFIGQLELNAVPGGEKLLRQGESADSFHIVVSGRFAVIRNGGAPLALIGRGEPVGEIAFFTGGTRTADVTATRDSEVLTLSRAHFDALAEANPALWRSVVMALATRLETATAIHAPPPAPPAQPRTVVIAPAGGGAMPEGFAAALAIAVSAHGMMGRLLDEPAVRQAMEGAPLDAPETNRWLAAQEADHDLLLFAIGRDADDWARKAVRQADASVLVGGGDPAQTSAVETLIAERLRPADIHLAVTEGQPSQWLEGRTVGAHHRAEGSAGIAALARFLSGTARGLVLGGGGALCGAHVGVAFALREAGVGFESYGGTSAGAAVGAALAMEMPRAEIIERCKDIFLTNKSLRRWTIPRYGLVDPETVDRLVRTHYGEGQVEDMRHPFFAMATDLADSAAHVMDRGPLWQAMRATCSIPVLLPPIIDAEGRILVDGGILDNLPVDRMRARKRGPNIAVVLGPTRWRRANFRYSDYPSRRALLAETVTPWKKRQRLKAPRATQVLTRSILLASDAEAQDALCRAEVVFQPPLPKGMGIMAWHRFEAHEQDSYDWARAEIDRRLKEDPEVLADFL